MVRYICKYIIILFIIKKIMESKNKKIIKNQEKFKESIIRRI